MVSGIVGSFIGTPADLIMVRMIADMTSSPGRLLENSSNRLYLNLIVP